ncbi:MAG: YHS domain-containing protein [Pseudomonadota bacterium]|nr:YHS domain-containing protein [Pseudomonadota bacterium]
MRSLSCGLLLAVLTGCGGAPPEAPTAAAAPAAPAVAAATPAGEAWSRVPLADGAIATANAAAVVPAAFRNGAGDVACPVMGMAIPNPEEAVSYADHAGVRYYFCCDSCEKLFLADPLAYADGKYLKSHNLDPSAPAACEDAAIEG